MKIDNTNTQIYNRTSPNFESSRRAYKNIFFSPLTGSEIFTSTCLARTDFSANKLIEYAINHFKDNKKVNIRCFAGSDGSEAYTLGVALLEKLKPQELSKFSPIFSSDKDPIIVRVAKSGKINLSSIDFDNLQKEINPQKQYFKPCGDAILIDGDINDRVSYKGYEVSPELQKMVTFSHGNLLEQVRTIEDDGNSIILCRNVMPYLHPSNVSEIAYHINENLKKGSLFVIGNFDRQNTQIANYLNYYGFSEVMNNVFEQNEEPSFNFKL